MLRFLVALSCVLACSAYAPATPALHLSKVASSRVEGPAMMARAAPKKAAKAAPKKVVKKVVKKAAPKKAAPKKAAPKPVAKKAAPKAAPKKSFGKSPVGKGGIFPWITNEPGTYGKPLTLSAVDFTSDEGDAWIGWGFMPKSVKDSLYPKGNKGMFGK